MKHTLQLQGKITEEPAYDPPYTHFQLQTEEKSYRILREEPVRQAEDLIFLRKGFEAQVIGRETETENTVLADKIILTEYFLRNFEKK